MRPSYKTLKYQNLNGRHVTYHMLHLRFISDQLSKNKAVPVTPVFTVQPTPAIHRLVISQEEIGTADSRITIIYCTIAFISPLTNYSG